MIAFQCVTNLRECIAILRGWMVLYRLDDELEDSIDPPFRGEFFFYASEINPDMSLAIQVILLMEEILHLLMRSLSVYPIVNRFFTSWWCRISSINSRVPRKSKLRFSCKILGYLNFLFLYFNERCKK